MSHPKRVQLIGVLESGTAAKTHQADDVVRYESADGKIKIRHATPDDKNTLFLETLKGTYVLKKHEVHNNYLGICGGIKVHVSLKRIIGELRYW